MTPRSRRRCGRPSASPAASEPARARLCDASPRRARSPCRPTRWCTICTRGDEVKQALAEHFGPEVLDADGEVDRRRLAEAVRGKPERAALARGSHSSAGGRGDRPVHRGGSGRVRGGLRGAAAVRGGHERPVRPHRHHRGRAESPPRSARSTRSTRSMFAEFEALQASTRAAGGGERPGLRQRRRRWRPARVRARGVRPGAGAARGRPMRRTGPMR